MLKQVQHDDQWSQHDVNVVQDDELRGALSEVIFNVVEKVFEIRIDGFYKINFPVAVPAFKLFFPGYGFFDSVEALEVNEFMQVVSGSE